LRENVHAQVSDYGCCDRRASLGCEKVVHVSPLHGTTFFAISLLLCGSTVALAQNARTPEWFKKLDWDGSGGISPEEHPFFCLFLASDSFCLNHHNQLLASCVSPAEIGRCSCIGCKAPGTTTTPTAGRISPSAWGYSSVRGYLSSPDERVVPAHEALGPIPEISPPSFSQRWMARCLASSGSLASGG